MVGLSADDQRNMWCNGIDAMAELHKLDTTSAEAQALTKAHHIPASLPEQLQYWEDYRHWTFGEDPGNAACDQALAWLKTHQPEAQTIAFCWGDSRMPNVMFNNHETAVAALLDWEMLTLGDPLQDLAWWIYLDELFSVGMDTPRLPGLPDRMETAAQWSQKTGLSTAHLDYYIIYAGLRFGLIFSRIMRNMGAADAALENFASQYLEKQMQALEAC